MKYKNKGFSLIGAIMISVIMAILVAGAVFLLKRNTDMVNGEVNKTRLFHAAEGGMQFLLKKLRIPSNYKNSSFSYKATKSASDLGLSGAKINLNLQIVRRGNNYELTSTSIENGRTCTISLTPQSESLLKYAFFSLAKFGSVIPYDTVILGDMYNNGRVRVQVRGTTGNFEGPRFYGDVDVNTLNNPYTEPNESEWAYWFARWSNVSGIEPKSGEKPNSRQWGYVADNPSGGYRPYVTPSRWYGGFTYDGDLNSKYYRGLNMSFRSYSYSEVGGNVPNDKMEELLDDCFRGNFNYDSPLQSPEMQVVPWSEMMSPSSKALKIEPTHPELAGKMTSGTNTNNRVVANFKSNGKVNIKVYNGDNQSTVLKDLGELSYNGKDYLTFAKEFGDIYVAGEIKSSITIVTEKDNIVIYDDLYSTEYRPYKDLNINLSNYDETDDNNPLNKLKSTTSNVHVGLIPMHDTENRYWYGYYKDKENMFNNESFGTAQRWGDIYSYPRYSTIKVKQNNNTDSPNNNNLLVTAAVYAQHNSMVLLPSNANYSDGSWLGYYSYDNDWNDMHTINGGMDNWAKKWSSNNKILLMGSYIGYDYPSTSGEATFGDPKGLKPIMVTNPSFRTGSVPPGFKVKEVDGSGSGEYKMGTDEWGKKIVVLDTEGLNWEVSYGKK